MTLLDEHGKAFLGFSFDGQMPVHADVSPWKQNRPPFWLVNADDPTGSINVTKMLLAQFVAMNRPVTMINLTQSGVFNKFCDTVGGKLVGLAEHCDSKERVRRILTVCEPEKKIDVNGLPSVASSTVYKETHSGFEATTVVINNAHLLLENDADVHNLPTGRNGRVGRVLVVLVTPYASWFLGSELEPYLGMSLFVQPNPVEARKVSQFRKGVFQRLYATQPQQRLAAQFSDVDGNRTDLMLATYNEETESMARSADTSPETLMLLTESPFWHVRCLVAGNPNTSPETLTLLSRDRYSAVRLEVVHNRLTVSDALRTLCEDSDEIIAAAALQHPNMPPALRAFHSL